MTFRYLDISNEEFDARVLNNPDGGTMFNLVEYGICKERHGWSYRLADCDGIALLILERQVAGLGKIWVLPKGPGTHDLDDVLRCLPQLKEAARQAKAFLVKVEPELVDSAPTRTALRAAGLVEGGPLQLNDHTILLDLSKPEDQLYAEIHKKRRNDLRFAAKEGVEVVKLPAEQGTYDLMWQQWNDVNIDQGITVRAPEYYREYWRTYLESGYGHIFAAVHEGRTLATAFVVLAGQKSIYKDGASVRDHPVRGVSYLLQWEVIRWLKEHGSLEHDLCGTPPADRIDDKTHPFYGIGFFKRAFHDEVTDYVGGWDLVVDPLRTALWHKAGFGLWRRTVGRRTNDPYFY